MVVLFFAFFHSPLPFYNGMEMKREKGKGKNEKKESTKHKGYTSSGSLFFFSLLLLLISCFHSVSLHSIINEQKTKGKKKKNHRQWDVRILPTPGRGSLDMTQVPDMIPLSFSIPLTIGIPLWVGDTFDCR